MDKDINRIKVVLAEKGGGRETIECLVEGTSEPTNGLQNSWGRNLLLFPNGARIIANPHLKHL